jgi:HD-like signal output (HDOD) protein
MSTNAAADNTATAIKIAESIAALPPLPATAQEILTCFGDEFIDAKKVTAVVEGDPGICAKLLGLANSAYFGLAEPVNNIGEAILRVLGVDTVRSLVLAMAIQQSFNSRKCPEFDTGRFWTQSLLTAECCKKIAAVDKQVTDAIRDLAYSAGLCHNLGLLAIAHMEPQTTNMALQAHSGEQKAGDLRNVLHDKLNTDHRIMTAELARIWSLPGPMVAAYQFRAYSDPQSTERLGVILSAAAVAVGNTEVEEDQQVPLARWAGEFGLEPEALQKMADFGERQQERVQSLAGNMSG